MISRDLSRLLLYQRILLLRGKRVGNKELQELVTNLKGIGDKTGKLFEKCGVKTIGNLLEYYPRGYDHFKAPVRACDLRSG